jgi:hypothetical protein
MRGLSGAGNTAGRRRLRITTSEMMSNRYEALAAEYLRRLAKQDMRAWRRAMSDVAIADENTSEQKEAVRMLRRVRGSKRAES